MPDTTATISLNTDDTISEIPRTIFGGFAEHMGRCIYGGIFDPESDQADEAGIRKDVLAALREMELSVLRYPGGNFVSSYDWRDGVGPRDQRPRRRELAWQQIETNQFGTSECLDFCNALGVEPMLAVNLGTGTIMEAGNLVEYCNAPVGTEFADLRAAHGYPQPRGVKYWCLGNEMDGPWQVGQMTAEDYAKKAREAAKIMRLTDSSIQTILCGSSGPSMKTYPAWDRTALEVCWEYTNYLALHNYANNDANDSAAYLGYGAEFEKHIETLALILRETKQKLGAKNDIYLSQDEWNVWYKNREVAGKWRVGPPLCEETYNLEDVLVVGQWMNVFLRHCDVLKMACLAQIVNTIAPLKTRGNELLKESIFHAFVMYSKYARGRSLRPRVTAPILANKRFGDVPQIDVSATIDANQKRAAVFIVHRTMNQTLRTDVTFAGPNVPTKIAQIQQIAGLDPKAANTFDRPDVVLPRSVAPVPIDGGKLSLKLPPLSLTMVEFAI